MGYDTWLSEGGGGLSGGQRQRLALARALLTQPALLLLDEATSHLDAVTDAVVDHNLSELSCTRVVIAHRLSTIRNADVILVLDEGAIVERGTHDELIARGGHYAAMVRGQRAEEPTLSVTSGAFPHPASGVVLLSRDEVTVEHGRLVARVSCQSPIEGDASSDITTESVRVLIDRLEAVQVRRAHEAAPGHIDPSGGLGCSPKMNKPWKRWADFWSSCCRLG